MAFVKRTETIDGVAVYVTGDGEICDGAGRTFGRVKLPMHAALMVAGEIELAFAFEVVALIKAATRLLRTDSLSPGNLRAGAFAVECREPRVWQNGWLVPLRT